MRLILILSLLCYLAFSQSKKRWSSNQRYFYSGRVTIDLILLQAVSQYAVTFPASMVSSNTVAYVTWTDLNMPWNTSSLSLFAAVSNLTSASMNIQISVGNTTTVLRMGVSYLLLRWQGEALTNYNNFVITQVNLNPNIGVGSYSFSIAFDQVMDLARGFVSSVMLNGLGFLASTNYNSQIFIFALVNGVNEKNVMITIQNYCNDAVLVNFSALIIVISYRYYYSYYGYRQDIFGLLMRSLSINQSRNPNYDRSNYYYYNYYQAYTPFNAIGGLYYIRDYSSINFQMSFDYSTISLASTNRTSNSYQYGTNTLAILSFYCSYQTPYYNPFTQMCYSTCPTYYANDEGSLSCKIDPINKAISSVVGSVVLTVLITLGFYVFLREWRKCEAQDHEKEAAMKKQNQNIMVELDPNSSNLQINGIADMNIGPNKVVDASRSEQIGIAIK